MRKTLFASIAVAAVLCMAVPAAAQTFTTTDGVLSIELPDDTWKEISDPANWYALSDGGNLITFEHYSNGEELPEITVADSHYVNVFQAAFSTQNEVFIVTGSVLDAGKITEINNAIASIKILKYDTKMALKKEEKASVSEFSLAAMDTVMYATAGVNVRSGCSTDDPIIGAIGLGTSIRVTGSVQRNGADYGWYQVDYNGTAAYIYAAFLSTTAPEVPSGQTSEGTGISFTGWAKTLYDSNGGAISIYEASDNNWYDGSGNKYIWVTTYEFMAEKSGIVYTTNKPQTDYITPTGDSFTVFWSDGTGTSLTPYSDGYYYSPGWVRYYAVGDGTYGGADGTILYSYAPAQAGQAKYEHKLTEQTTGTEVIVSNTQSADAYVWYDADGTEYQNNGDGTFTDYYGNHYNVVW